MGALKKLSRAMRADRARTRNVALSKQIMEFYQTHPIHAWQTENVKQIRGVYEEKQKDLDRAHDIGSSELSDVFMQFELDYLRASHDFAEKNPGMEYHPKGLKGLFTKAFWRNLTRQGKVLGIDLTYGKQG